MRDGDGLALKRSSRQYEMIRRGGRPERRGRVTFLGTAASSEQGASWAAGRSGAGSGPGQLVMGVEAMRAPSGAVLGAIDVQPPAALCGRVRGGGAAGAE